MPLADVLQTIGEQSGVDIKMSGELGDVRPQQFSDIPLALGIRRLVGSNSLVMIHSSQDGPPRLVAVRVYAASPPVEGEAVEREQRGGRRESAVQRQAAEQRLSGRTAAAERERTALLQRVRELARAQDPQGVPELAEVLTGEADASTRRLAVNALANIGGEEATAALRTAVDDPDPTISVQALRSLQSVMGEQMTSVLAEVVETHPDPTLRRTAVEIAARLQGDEARAVIERALEDSDEAVRSAAEKAAAR